MKNSKCENCQINKLAENQGGCCVWYMDNVVIEGKSVDECTDYKPIKKKIVGEFVDKFCS